MIYRFLLTNTHTPRVAHPIIAFHFPKKKKLRPYPWSIHGATRLAKVGHIFGKVEGKVVGWSGSLGWLVTMKKQSNQVDLLNKVWSQLEQIWSGCYSPGVRVARVATKGALMKDSYPIAISHQHCFASCLSVACMMKKPVLFTWNPKQPFINGCFKWMIPILYIGNGWK